MLSQARSLLAQPKSRRGFYTWSCSLIVYLICLSLLTRHTLGPVFMAKWPPLYLSSLIWAKPQSGTHSCCDNRRRLDRRRDARLELTNRLSAVGCSGREDQRHSVG